MSTHCHWCIGGMIAVEPGGSLRYRGPDCNGTGRIVTDEELDHETEVDLAEDLAAEKGVTP